MVHNDGVVVECIRDWAQLDALRSDWEALYLADPNAQLFLSWDWMRACCDVTERNWCVLVARTEHTSQCVGILPLATAQHHRRGLTLIQLYLGGTPYSDSTGLLALPEYEDVTVKAMADYVPRMRWDEFYADDVRDSRVDRLVALLPGRAFIVRPNGETPCPYIDLPSSFDEYLEKQLLGNRKLRRSIRAVEGIPGYRLVQVEESNLELHIATLIRLWQARWHKDLDSDRRKFGELLRSCFRAGCLRLPIIFDGDIPVAAAALLIDQLNCSYCGYIQAFNQDYAKASPSIVLLIGVIQEAIERGYRRFDFLRGGESYKYDFGAQTRWNRHTLVGRRNSARRAVWLSGRMLARAGKRFLDRARS